MDIRASALGALQSAFRVFGKDLEALPEEAYSRQFGPKCRTVADIVYEVNLVNDHAGMKIRGEEPFPWPDDGWIKAPDGFADKDTVVSAFETSRNKLVATIEAMSAEELEATITTEQGESSRFDTCRFVTLHLWYHSGQLNFIQTLLGDDGWHW